MTPDAAARFAATRETLREHVNNALQIVSAALMQAQGLSFSETLAVRNRLEAIKDLAEEGRKLAAGRVAVRAKQWAEKRL